jgi:hypothetical protein
MNTMFAESLRRDMMRRSERGRIMIYSLRRVWRCVRSSDQILNLSTYGAAGAKPSWIIFVSGIGREMGFEDHVSRTSASTGLRPQICPYLGLGYIHHPCIGVQDYLFHRRSLTGPLETTELSYTQVTRRHLVFRGSLRVLLLVAG